MDKVMFNLLHRLLSGAKAQVRQLNLQIQDYEDLLAMMKDKPSVEDVIDQGLDDRFGT